MRIEDLVAENHKNLNENDWHIWQYILDNKEICYKYNIKEFAKKCNVSETSLFRFAKKISLEGFSELRAKLKWEDEEKIHTYKDYLEETCNNFHKIVDNIREKNCDSIFRSILIAERVFIYSDGYASETVANEIKRIFLSGGECFFVISNQDTIDSFLSVVHKEDLVFIISLSEKSAETNRLAQKLKIKKVPIIAVTGVQNNELSYLSDEILYINTNQIITHNNIEHEIMTPYFILVELLFLKYKIYLLEKNK